MVQTPPLTLRAWDGEHSWFHTTLVGIKTPFKAYALARKIFRERRDQRYVVITGKNQDVNDGLILRRNDGYDKVSDWFYLHR